jgi:chemotaxis protein CheX
MMRETDLHFFIDSTLNYFEEVTSEKAQTGIPYLKEHERVVLDYTGIIGISGKRKGSVYITASSDMLNLLAQEILGVDVVDTEDLKDLVGEIANIISVPVIVEGMAKDIKMPDEVQAFVIPITWKSLKAFLVVCLE